MILPERAVLFARRAARLRRLAEGHALGDYLRFLASLAEAQQAALDAFPEVPLPTERDLALARGHGLPPLSAGSWPRAHAWRSALRQILGRAREPADLPGAARLAIDRLAALGENAIEEVAGVPVVHADAAVRGVGADGRVVRRAVDAHRRRAGA